MKVQEAELCAANGKLLKFTILLCHRPSGHVHNCQLATTPKHFLFLRYSKCIDYKLSYVILYYITYYVTLYILYSKFKQNKMYSIYHIHLIIIA